MKFTRKNRQHSTAKNGEPPLTTPTQRRLMTATAISMINHSPCTTIMCWSDITASVAIHAGVLHAVLRRKRTPRYNSLPDSSQTTSLHWCVKGFVEWDHMLRFGPKSGRSIALSVRSTKRSQGWWRKAPICTVTISLRCATHRVCVEVLCWINNLMKLKSSKKPFMTGQVFCVKKYTPSPGKWVGKCEECAARD